jgi:hypothetical protein
MARRDRGSIPGAGCDRGSNEARGPFARKPFGRRLFCPWPSLARPLQPAEGMLGPRRLGHGQNPSPQDPTQFQNRLLGEADANAAHNAHTLADMIPLYLEPAFRALLFRDIR